MKAAEESRFIEWLSKHTVLVANLPIDKRWHKYNDINTGKEICMCLPNKGSSCSNSFAAILNNISPIICKKKCNNDN